MANVFVWLCMPYLQEGTSAYDGIYAIGIADDGSMICGGDTLGAWVGTNAGMRDFVAVKLSASGTEEWRWQVRPLFWKFATAASIRILNNVLLSKADDGLRLLTKGEAFTVSSYISRLSDVLPSPCF